MSETDKMYTRAKQGWLIERKLAGHPEWWNGLRFVIDDDKAWDSDSNKAIVFADWASAASLLNNLRVETMQKSELRGPHAYMERMQLSVTEHLWPAPAQEG
jgi:hypothetical protein